MVWIAQGVDVLGGSGMSGHAIWAVIGAVLVVVGFAMVVGGYRSRGRATHDDA